MPGEDGIGWQILAACPLTPTGRLEYLRFIALLQRPAEIALHNAIQRAYHRHGDAQRGDKIGNRG
jgi:hypothetical protein